MSSKNSDDDLTHLLDGWKPGAGLDGGKPDKSLPPVDELQPRRRTPSSDAEAGRLPKDLDLNVPTRYSKWDSSDVTDVDAVWKPSDFVARAAEEVPVDVAWQPGTISTRGLVGEAVLLHEPGLRDFLLKELRAFVDAERQATWDRANKAYKLPASGQPIERI